MVNQQIKKRAIHRAKIICGQLNALAKAIESESYCVDLLLQSLSIQKSLKSLDRLLLENHLVSHVSHQMKSRHEEAKAIKELLEIYTYK